MTDITLERVFEVVEKRAQNAVRGEDKNGTCAYRGDDGLKCFVGELIPDELYDDSIEGFGMKKIKTIGYDGPRNTDEHIFYTVIVKAGLMPHLETLDKLQEIHDLIDPSEWLKAIANLKGKLCKA